ncbi:protein LTV1 homolog [Protopterus annectens]|uniref:protein LTV1 homolog n=1 Tax=Protopterus annectens TaxID=7888 RepID=UPI001CFA465A|nr:protein LTV1 homolog [Protopterus annectens]
MPHRKKKPFIDKKKAVTFHLVHRSQRDPLAADETAPQRVLLPAEKRDVAKRQEEQMKYGVFFDDDYDYLQHLKEASGPCELVPSSSPHNKNRICDADEDECSNDDENEVQVEYIPAPVLNLPSSVFASEFEEEVGLLNKAAPVRGLQLDLDPDVVAALDDDFDFDSPENVLEDDFVVKANQAENGDEGDYREDEANDYGDEDEWEDAEDEDFDSEGPLSEEEEEEEPAFPMTNGRLVDDMFMNEETRSRFTDYSMTSSVIRRNEQLTLLDERFEKFYEQFDEDEIGALDNAELEGYIATDSTRLQYVIQDFYSQKAKECKKLDDLCSEEESHVNKDDEECSQEEDLENVVVKEPKEKWDCESILSTYSNLYNHPTLIIEPPTKTKLVEVSKKTGVPLGVLPQRSLTSKQVERMQMINDSDLPRAATQPRDKSETKDERKTRKKAIKEERKERRMEKKANRMAFKIEKSRQEKEMLNLRQNIQGLKLS